MNRKLAALAPMILCGAIMLWSAARVLDPHLLLFSWDFEGHLLRAHFWLRDVFLAGRTGGWFPYWHGGFPLPEVYPPLAAWILGFFSLLGIGEMGGRLLIVAGWIAAVPASYHFLRRFGVSERSAAIAACLVPALNTSRSFGALAVFWLGLIPNELGFVLSILAVAETKALLSDRPTAPQAVRCALLGGLTVLAHPFCAYWTAVAALVLVATELPGRADGGQRATMAVLAGLGATIVGAFYWAPFFINRANVLPTDPFVSFPPMTVARNLALMKEAGGPAALLLAFFGVSALAAPGRRRSLAFFAMTAALTFSLSLGVIPGTQGLFGGSQKSRFEGFYLWIILMTTGFGLDAAFGSKRWKWIAFGGLSGLVAWVSLASVPQNRFSADAGPAAALAELQSLSDKLATRLRPGDFVLTEQDRRPFRQLGSPHFLNQRLPLLNPSVWDAGGGLPEGAKGSLEMLIASRLFPGSVESGRDALRRHGVRFVATVRTDSAAALAKVPWLTRLWPEAGQTPLTGLSLYEVAGPDARLGLPTASAERLSDVRFDAGDGYDLRFSSPTALAFPCETAISFHPWLRAADGKGQPVGLAPTSDGRLVLVEGPPILERISIAYRPPASVLWARRLSLLAMALFLALSGAFLLAARRSRKN